MSQLIRSRAACLAVAMVTLAVCLECDSALAVDTKPASSGPPRIVNVTSDSMPGWTPSVELENEARKTAIDFMAALDGGRVADAYGFLADLERKQEPFSSFSDDLRKFNNRAGAVLERRIVTITWTKNPTNAPLPGIYVALDQISRFANIDRHCGYMVLYQAPAGGAFRVMRRENNFMDNNTAAGIAKQSSSAAVDTAWATISANCPGYKAPLTEDATSSIGYPSVEAALAALHAKAGVKFTSQNGWTVAEDTSAQTLWSFPPPGNPAYPSAVKRQFVTHDGGTTLQMTVHCDASKSACDDLVRSFEKLNAEMTASMRGHQ